MKGLHNKVATFRIDGETNGNILRGKEREREREETDDDALNGHGDSGWGGVAASAVPLSNLIEFSPDTPTSEKSRSLSTSQKTITASSSTAELESCVNVREHGGVDKRRTGNGEEAVGRGDEVEGSTGAGVGAERTLIVLFDNSYSWYTAKEIKYVTLYFPLIIPSSLSSFLSFLYLFLFSLSLPFMWPFLPYSLDLCPPHLT